MGTRADDDAEERGVEERDGEERDGWGARHPCANSGNADYPRRHVSNARGSAMTAAEPRTDSEAEEAAEVTAIEVRNRPTAASSVRCRSTAPKRWQPRPANFDCSNRREAIGPRGRKKWMMKWQDWILDNAEHLTEVLMSETGKAHCDACVEPIGIADAINYWAGHAEEFLTDRHPHPAHPALPGEEADHRLPPLPLGRHHRAVELPAGHARPRRGARPGCRCGRFAEAL